MNDFNQLFQFFGKEVMTGLSIPRRVSQAFDRLKGSNSLASQAARLQQQADHLNNQGRPKDKRKFLAKVLKPWGGA